MKIFSKIKGFVTNSSSANYWLDNGIVRVAESETSTSTGLTTITSSSFIENVLQNFLIWLCFSLILVIVFFYKIAKKHSINLKQVLNQQTIAAFVILAAVIIYLILRIKLASKGIYNVFLNDSADKLFFLLVVSPIFIGLFLFIYLLKDSLLIKQIKNPRLIIAIISIILVIVTCGYIFVSVNKEYEKSIEIFLANWFDLNRDQLMAQIFVVDEQTDVIIFLNSLLNSAFQKIFFASFIIFISAFLIILALPKKNNYNPFNNNQQEQ